MSDYAQHSITITLNFDTLNLPECVNLDDVAELLTDSRWDEGRYPFDEEMLHVGLGHLIEYAVGDAVTQAMRKRYGDQMIPQGEIGGPNNMVSVASIKTEEAMKHFNASTLDSIKVASIGRPVKE